MSKLKTIESRVLEVLLDEKKTRDDDMLLYFIVCQRCFFDSHGMRDISFNEFIHNFRDLGCPNFESVRRTRQMIQSQYLAVPKPDAHGAEGKRLMKNMQRRQQKMAKDDIFTPNFQQKSKTLKLLFEKGVTDEKSLLALSTIQILQIATNYQEAFIISELQVNSKANKLYSYLGGNTNEQQSEVS